MLKGLKEAWKKSWSYQRGEILGNLGLKGLKGILLGSLRGTLRSVLSPIIGNGHKHPGNNSLRLIMNPSFFAPQLFVLHCLAFAVMDFNSQVMLSPEVAS